MRKKIATKPHPIYFERGSLSRLADYPIAHFKPRLLITDQTVYSLYGREVASALQVEHLIVPQGEAAKTLQVAEGCWLKMSELGINRDEGLIALGGGGVGDLSGFVAANYMRGIALIHLPTTLLSMVDAAIGGKNAVNFGLVKNLIGAFHQPALVLMDPEVLKSLPMDQFRGALAEIIKCGVIRDVALFEKLETSIDQLASTPLLLDEVIGKAAKIKADIVAIDEREGGIRAHLNYGHTLGHALEAISNYQIPHGEAVSIGMSFAARLSLRLKLAKQDLVDRQDHLLRQAKLPLHPPFFPDFFALLHAMTRDKKVKRGKFVFVLPLSVGTVEVRQVDPEDILATLTAMNEEGRHG